MTLDLNGFTVQGPATCTANLCVPLPPAPGIDAQATNVTVRNGIVKQFAGNGINFVTAGSFEDLIVRDNTGVGISRSANSQAEHDRTLMRHVQAQSNGSHGVVSRDTELVDCAAVNNAGHGFLLADSSVLDSSASANRNYGLYATGNVLLRGSQLYLNLVKNYGNWVISAGGNLNDGSLF